MLQTITSLTSTSFKQKQSKWKEKEHPDCFQPQSTFTFQLHTFNAVISLSISEAISLSEGHFRIRRIGIGTSLPPAIAYLTHCFLQFLDLLNIPTRVSSRSTLEPEQGMTCRHARKPSSSLRISMLLNSWEHFFSFPLNIKGRLEKLMWGLCTSPLNEYLSLWQATNSPNTDNCYLKHVQFFHAALQHLN